jgi:hypothetical protein
MTRRKAGDRRFVFRKHGEDGIEIIRVGNRRDVCG